MISVLEYENYSHESKRGISMSKKNNNKKNQLPNCKLKYNVPERANAYDSWVPVRKVVIIDETELSVRVSHQHQLDSLSLFVDHL